MFGKFRVSGLALVITASLPLSVQAMAVFDITGRGGISLGFSDIRLIGTQDHTFTNTPFIQNMGNIPTLIFDADLTDAVASGGLLRVPSARSVGTITINGRLASTGAQASAIWVDGSLGVLNNSGTIQAANKGILLLNGSSGTVINQLAGSINAPTAIDASGTTQDITLNWSGGSISGHVTGLKYLNLDLDAATLSGGNLSMAANSVTRLRLTEDNSQSLLSVGNYSFGAGSELRLRPSASNFAVDNQSYTLIAGNGDATGNLSVVSESAYLTIHSSSVANGISAVVSIAKAPAIAQAGGSANAQAAANAIAPLLSDMANQYPNDPVLDALAGSQSVQTSEQLVPQVNGGSLQAAYSLGNMASANANQRSQSLRGASAGDAFSQQGLWIKALGSDLTQKTRAQIEGYNADLKGFAIGGDGKLSDQFTLGLSYSYLDSDIHSKGGNRTDSDGHALTLYGGYEQGPWFVDGSLSLGLSHNDSTRLIAASKAKGDYDSRLLGMQLLGGYVVQLTPNLLLEPRVGARYARVDIDSLHEKGSVAALRVAQQRYEVAELGAGLRVAGDWSLGQGRVQPQATLMAYHDFAADQVQSRSSFTFGGSPFISTGAKPVRTRYEAGVGVDYVQGSTTFGLRYDYSGKTGFHGDTLQASLRYDF